MHAPPALGRRLHQSGGIPFWEFIAPVALDTDGMARIWKVPAPVIATARGPGNAAGANGEVPGGWGAGSHPPAVPLSAGGALYNG